MEQRILNEDISAIMLTNLLHQNQQLLAYHLDQDKQSKFVDYFVAEGKTQTEAARLAGYSFPEYEGYRLVRQPRMIQVIHAARQKYYQTNLANVAVSTLQQVMQDTNAPAAARVSATRTALELAGDLGPN